MRRRVPMVTRALWLLTACVGVFAISSALDGRSDPVIAVVTLESWAVWAVAWLAVLVPRTVSLTIARVLIPTASVAALVALLAGADARWGTLFVAAAVATFVSLLHGLTIDAFVDGSSYGPERRFALRTPPLLTVTAVPATWLIAAVGLTVPAALAAHQWVLAGLATLITIAGARFAWRSLHLLACRWVVFVPAGMVLHDPLTLADAILIPRRSIEALGPAMADTDAVDLTAGATGLALQVDVDRPLGVGVRQGRGSEPREVTANRFLFSVARPGALLDDATERRFAVGATSPHTPEMSGCGGHQPDHGDADTSQTAVPLPRTRSSR